jgi:hypothetical protein
VVNARFPEYDAGSAGPARCPRCTLLASDTVVHPASRRAWLRACIVFAQSSAEIVVKAEMRVVVKAWRSALSAAMDGAGRHRILAVTLYGLVRIVGRGAFVGKMGCWKCWGALSGCDADSMASKARRGLEVLTGSMLHVNDLGSIPSFILLT